MKTRAQLLMDTEQGKQWLEQFEEPDKETAIFLASELTLINHTEFCVGLQKKLETLADSFKGNVGFWAIKELDEDNNISLSENEKKPVDLIELLSEQGSEAIIYKMIRDICKNNHEKYLNHPKIEQLRATKSDAIIFVDDFIGTGTRVEQFLDRFWSERTLVSWLSGKQIEFHVVAYAGTETGKRRIEKHKSKPKVHLITDAPSLYSMAWSTKRKVEVIELCNKYGRIADKKRKDIWLGYQGSMVMLVFSHGCPNNAPLILWTNGSSKKTWKALFPNRKIGSEMASVFPNEMAGQDPLEILKAIGQQSLAKSNAYSQYSTVSPIILTTLALIAKGKRKRSTLSHCLELNISDCESIINICIKNGFIDNRNFITEKGLTEIRSAKKSKIKKQFTLEKGSDYYYPRQLREATHD